MLDPKTNIFIAPPAGVSGSIPRHDDDRCVGSVESSVRLPRSGRRDEEFSQLACALFVAPVADPEDIDIFVQVDGAEMFDIGGFVKCPDVLHSKTVGINAADRVAECKHAIEEM